MNTGAHPDDEHNGMLAALRFQHGMRVVVACSTRGEGGQNTLGPERQGALGVLRSREMEEAARIIDADVAWLGYGPDDAVHDFGFSKSGADTLARWGEHRILDRLVRAYRQFRPDIVIPTFLDVPGQHGHHRAMTQAAEHACMLAADPAYGSEGEEPWRVAKFYLPAWSGGGDTYDDELPPPPATSAVRALGLDEASGMSYDRLGEASRTCHASQNMGHWRNPPETKWPLHSLGGTEEASILDGLPTRLADLGSSPLLATADTALDDAVVHFPASEAVLRALIEARRAIKGALPSLSRHHLHRLERKLREIDAAIGIAAGAKVHAAVSSASVAPGKSIDLIVEAVRGRADKLTIKPVVGSAFTPPAELALAGDRAVVPIHAKADAAVTNAFHLDWQSLGGNGNVWLEIEAVVGEETVRWAVDTEEPVQVAPLHELVVSPDALILPLPTEAPRALEVEASEAMEQISVAPVPGLTIHCQQRRLVITPDAGLQPGRYHLPIQLGDAPAHMVSSIAYPHVGRTRFTRPLGIDVLALELEVPQARVAYIGGGADRVGLWLERMGVDATELDAEALGRDLSTFETIIVGIFAFGTRPELAHATTRLHAWIRNGGHLVTLYHRPSDGWSPDLTPPLPLTIGSPSLRWRVTNPAAPVTILVPEHKLLAGPNRITAADFEGWDKERGLYFSSAWDKAYQPLLSMSDAEEAPLTGSLLSAAVGKGRHTHTSLVLHHQLDKLVPGAFRLMANLLQAA
jgi:LmbE family N-acetylglucosaminyl deacetylase